MSDLAATDALFYDRTSLDRNRLTRLVSDSLHGTEDGELYLEYVQSENVVLDDGRIRSASFDTSQGFGLRSVVGEVSGYAHSGELSEPAIKRAAEAVQAVHGGHGGVLAGPPPKTNMALYSDINPLETLSFDAKVGVLNEIDAYARAKDPRVRQVTASLSAVWSAVQIIRPDGERAADIRPLVRTYVTIVVEQDGRMESGSHGAGARMDFAAFVQPEAWQAQVDEALRQALVNLAAVPAPAGEMTVVLGPGWPGVLLHEAVGHGLEGDFNRKKTSAFAGLLGERVAAPGVTVVDNGTLRDRCGSLTVDDEGTPTTETLLIENGVLKGYMQDRMNARLMGGRSTGNGRRQSYAHCPMVRMTNTYMLDGDKDPGEILESVANGIYAVNFGGGEVDITNGKFVFSCTEAYTIENGRIGTPVKGATLIGNGADALTKVSMIGNDLKLDDGMGTCGKEGQGVPVGVGQPTLRLDGLTVGGTAV